MATLPATSGPDETVGPVERPRGTARHRPLRGHRSAGGEDALDLNAEGLASSATATPPPADIARTRFHDYARCCASAAPTRHWAAARMPSGLPGRPRHPHARQHPQRPRRHRGQARPRRRRHPAGTRRPPLQVPGRGRDAIAVSYHNLGNYLRRHARQPAPALASHLAAALIRALTGTDDTGRRRSAAAATDLREFGTAAVPPADVADLCRQLGDISGTDLPGLIAALAPDPETAEQALRDLIAQAHSAVAAPESAPAPPATAASPLESALAPPDRSLPTRNCPRGACVAEKPRPPDWSSPTRARVPGPTGVTPVRSE